MAPSFLIRLGSRFRRGGLGIRGGPLGGRGILFCRLFVPFAAVVGDVKATAFEQQSAAGADLFLHPAPAPFFLRTPVFGTNPQRPGGHGLQGFKLVAAFFTGVFVGRHGNGRRNLNCKRRQCAAELVGGGRMWTEPSEPTSTLRSYLGARSAGAADGRRGAERNMSNWAPLGCVPGLVPSLIHSRRRALNASSRSFFTWARTSSRSLNLRCNSAFCCICFCSSKVRKVLLVSAAANFCLVSAICASSAVMALESELARSSKTLFSASRSLMRVLRLVTCP